MSKPKLGTVQETGAPHGAILIGVEDVNEHLRIRIMKDQKPGHGGWIDWAFEVLDAGTGTYATAVQPLVGEQFVQPGASCQQEGSLQEGDSTPEIV